MCNEFSLERSLEELIAEFGQLDLPLTWDGGAPNMEPRASIRPTDPAYIVVGDGRGAMGGCGRATSSQSAQWWRGRMAIWRSW
jgi:putative SOS response-associated peptidase YedK